MAKVHTGADVKNQFEPLSEADLQASCDEASFQKGYDYYLHHAIVEPTLKESVLRAFCHGSGLSPYRVEATLLPAAENGAHKLASAACSCTTKRKWQKPRRSLTRMKRFASTRVLSKDSSMGEVVKITSKRLATWPGSDGCTRSKGGNRRGRRI
jgi:hypothetical protein